MWLFGQLPVLNVSNLLVQWFSKSGSSGDTQVSSKIISGGYEMIVEKNQKSNIQNKITYFRLGIVFPLVCLFVILLVDNKYPMKETAEHANW